MYIFGEKYKNSLNEEVIENIIEQAKKNKKISHDLLIKDILIVLNKVSVLWKPTGKYYKKAISYLNNLNMFSEELNHKSLEILMELLSEKNLLERLNVEFENYKLLDEFGPFDRYDGKVKYKPLGVLLHVTAGNVFLGAIDSILMGVLTKNINIVKLSNSNTYIPGLFYESVLEADSENIIAPFLSLISWKGGDKSIEDKLKQSVDGIIMWGGDDMVESYSDTPRNVKLISHGPKISFHIVTKKAYENMRAEDFMAMSYDITMWEQSACANSQNIYLESGINVNEFSEKLDIYMKKSSTRNTDLDPDELVEKIKERSVGEYEEFLSGNKVFSNDQHLITFQSGLALIPTALNRSVKIRQYKNLKSLTIMLEEFCIYLQTCGLACDSDELSLYTHTLSNCGITRICNLGDMLNAPIGAPHDGSFNLKDLTHIITQDIEYNLKKFALQKIKKLEFYKNKSIKSFNDIPIISSKELSEFSPDVSDAFIDKSIEGSKIVFSTGGTTGDPKYSIYQSSEFKKISKLLAKSYLDLGLTKNDKVLNLFMAGNMWSSFSAIQYALEYCEVTQFPLGGLAAIDEMINIIKKFKINVLFGLPSTIVQILNKAPQLKIDKIFYAGEILNQSIQEKIKTSWGTTSIYSAGYATVDVGPIGYQVKNSTGTEHILFDELVYLEIIDGEAVVSSKIRELMPILRYRTGDKVQLVESSNALTIFKLLGRIDQKINIWASRIEFAQLEKAIHKVFKDDIEFQIIIEQKEYNNQLFDVLSISINSSISIEDELIKKEIYQECHDLNKTVSYSDICSKLFINYEPIKLSTKTGKLKRILDLRK